MLCTVFLFVMIFESWLFYEKIHLISLVKYSTQYQLIKFLFKNDENICIFKILGFALFKNS